MKLFGWELRRSEKAAPFLHPIDARGGWFPVVREPFTGAWQRNQEIQVDTALSFSTVYACVSLISSDIGKMGLRLMERDSAGIWGEVMGASPFWPVLRKPNRLQTRIKFFESWMLSRLINGNVYILKQRDARGVVSALYALDPNRCKVLVAPDGAVFYELRRDNLSGIEDESVTVPASEIIHDVMSPIYHPLCGVSPIQAAALAILGGKSMQHNAAKFFQNGAVPSGILTAPGVIDTADVERIRSLWEQKYSGDNAGRVAVLGGGLSYTPMTVSAADSQLINQLKFTAETVCSCFRVPAYMVGVGQAPTYNNIEALNQQYYQQCLQEPIESIELCLDEGLGLTEVPGKTLGVGFDTDDLLRMDTAAKVSAAADGIKAGLFAPNEQRKRFDLPPVDGGDTPYLQQQNFSLAALDRRDQSPDPFATASSAAPSAPTETEDDIDTEALGAMVTVKVSKGMTGLARYAT